MRIEKYHEYRCISCGHLWEVKHHDWYVKPTNCPECESTLIIETNGRWIKDDP